MQACRDAVFGLNRNTGSNAGLLLARYLHSPVIANPEEKKELLACAILATQKAAPLYRQAFKRHGERLAGTAADFSTEGRLILGLGAQNVLETGISLLHPYGTPYLPGSALKGLAAHYCDRVWGAADAQYKKNGEGNPRENHHHILFGDTEDAGFLVFHDAWILPESLGATSGLVTDVMTPHHGDYYSKRGGSAPTDFDDPNPVQFLSVTGKFRVVVSCADRGENGRGWERLALRILKEALGKWGIGGKTNAGYGRMKCGDDFLAPNTPPEAGNCSDNTPLPVQRISVRMKRKNDRGNPQFVSQDGKNKRCTFDGTVPDLLKGESIEVVLVRENKADNSYVVRLANA